LPIVVFVALSLLLPSVAHAHLVQTGFGTFYDGMAHLMITPGDLLVVMGLGLLAGLRGREISRGVLVTLPGAWLGGGLIGMWVARGGAMPLLTTLTFGLIGLLVALDRKLPRAGVVALACIAGLLHGYVNGATMTAAGMDWLALVGAVVMGFVLVTLLPAAVVSVRPAWARIAVRVAGSWIAAIGMLMLGWLAKGS